MPKGAHKDLQRKDDFGVETTAIECGIMIANIMY